MNKIGAGNAIPVTAAVARPSAPKATIPQKQQPSKLVPLWFPKLKILLVCGHRRPKSAARKTVVAQAAAGEADVSTPRPGDPSFKPNPQDMKTLNEIVAIGKWDEVEKKVKAMSERGEVSEGLLEAAVHLITVCHNLGEASQKPNAASITDVRNAETQTLEKVANLIAFCLQSGYMPPNVKLMDKVMTMDPVSQEAESKSRIP
eukprot:1179330-Prorocentrum_minimum.AAC.3